MSSENAVKHWRLYLIKTAKNTLYCGITLDMTRRFKEHSAQSSKTAKSLRGKGPLELMYVVTLKDHSTALKAERWVKAQPKTTKQQLIAGAYSLPFEHCISSPEETLNIKCGKQTPRP